jgi:ribose transport system ATP-binding protein
MVVAPATLPLLSLRGAAKSFPGVRALNGVDLDVRAGEVLALLGENGAGKSTLIKALAGVHALDAGEIRIHGKPTAIPSPARARELGIAVIHQELSLVPALSARENIFLGQERTRAGFISRRSERRAAKELFRRLGVAIDPATPCKELSVAARQIVEIARSLARDASLIVMDEPSATLSGEEVGRLFQIVRELKSRGIGVIYISHRLEEIFEIADRVTVLRDGAHVATRAIANVDRMQLVEMMVGRRIEREFPPRSVTRGDVLLQADRLTREPAVRDVSFAVREGEVLAITGLVGAGRTELARLIFGADRADSGSVRLRGRQLRLRSPRDAIAAGICLLTEDRKSQGLIPRHSVRDNFALPNLNRLSRFGVIRRGRERRELNEYIARLRIKLADPMQPAAQLSGGNQQKVVLAKWLARHCDVLIFDEPTRGIDVGGKFEIYELINELAGRGKAIVLISSEIPEVLGTADRVLVMHRGRLAGEFNDPSQATQEAILELAIG